jgi:hypothetical protein
MIWKSIASAPRNRPVLITGSAILLSGQDSVIWTGEAMWDMETGQWLSQCYDSFGNLLVVYPTHWIDLPKIPSSA